MLPVLGPNAPSQLTQPSYQLSTAFFQLPASRAQELVAKSLSTLEVSLSSLEEEVRFGVRDEEFDSELSLRADPSSARCLCSS